MTTNFDYQGCTIEELADYVQSNTPNRISQALIYYKDKGNTEMIEKIKEARKVVKKRKLVKMLEAM